MASAVVTIDFTIPEEDVKISRNILGEGACSRVFKATWKGAAVAIKCIRPDSLPVDRSSGAQSKKTYSKLEELRRELQTMCGLRHPNIVRLYGVYAPATRYIGIVMELMDTSLQSRITEGPVLLTPCLSHILYDLTSALIYLHSQKVIHRDISPRNVLLSDDSAQLRLVAKLSDFATSKAVNTIGFDRYSATSGQFGTLPYLPYEAVDKDPKTGELVYSSTVDIYSVGAVGLFAALRKVPGCTPRAKPEYLQSLGSEHVLHSVLKECLDDDPTLRPTSADLQIKLERIRERETCPGSCCALLTRARSFEGGAQRCVTEVTHCNAKTMARNELPEHVNRLVKQVEEREEEGVIVEEQEEEGVKQAEEQEEEGQMEPDWTICKIKVFYRGKIGDVAVGKRLEVHKDKTLREAVEVAHKLFELEGTVPVDQCRLVKYDDFYESFERSFEGMEETSMGQLLGGVCQSYLYDLLLESRHSDEEFDIYTPNGCTLKVFVINLAEGKVEFRHIVHTSLDCTIGELKKIFERKYRYPAATLRLAVEKTHMDHTLLSSASSSLRSEGFYRSGKLYIETVGETTKGPFNQTRFFSVLDSFVHGIALHVTLPAPVPEAGNESYEAAVRNGLAITSFGSSDPDGTSQKSGGTVSDDGKAGKSEPAAPTGREVTLRVDRRITVSKFKELLSEHVGAATDQFKLFRSYPNGQEFEVTRPNDTLSQYSNDTKIVVKMGRALRAGEVRIKLFLLRPSEVEFAELLTESIVCEGMTVAQLKEQLVKELKAAGSSVQLHAKRMRLRKKTWKDPRTVLFDHYKFDEEIMIYPGWEGFVQELAGDDPKTSGTQTAVFVRQWKPSFYTLGPIEEIILDDTQVSTLKASISKLSGIPVENVDFAKPRNSFPCDTNVLELENDVSWNPAVSSLSQYPLHIHDDGTVVYYRDCTEKLQSLTDEQRLELQKRETARLQRSSASRTTYSYSRKEKALKIYTDTSSNSSSDNEA